MNYFVYLHCKQNHPTENKNAEHFTRRNVSKTKKGFLLYYFHCCVQISKKKTKHKKILENLVQKRQFNLKLTPKIYRIVCRIWIQHIAQIFNNDVGIIVSFQKPVIVVQMIFINVFERQFSFSPQMVWIISNI